MTEEQQATQVETKKEPTVEEKLKDSEDKVQNLESKLQELQKKYNLAASLAVNGYTLMVEVGHNLVQNGSTLQEFTMNNKNTYATLLGEFYAKQQSQATKK